MPTIETNTASVEASISAVVIRADGTREDLGTISYWHRNPLRRLAWATTHKVRTAWRH